MAVLMLDHSGNRTYDLQVRAGYAFRNRTASFDENRLTLQLVPAGKRESIGQAAYRRFFLEKFADFTSYFGVR